jgi:hypothetical protein
VKGVGFLARRRRRRARLEGIAEHLWSYDARNGAARLDISPADGESRRQEPAPAGVGARQGVLRQRRKLRHYISAGGLRQLRRSRPPAGEQERPGRVRRLFLGLLLFWLLFRWVRC